MAKKHKQAHYFEIFNIFLLVVVGLLAYIFRDDLNATIVTIGVLAYFLLNIIHAARTHTLNTTRVIELGALALIAEFILLIYVI